MREGGSERGGRQRRGAPRPSDALGKSNNEARAESESGSGGGRGGRAPAEHGSPPRRGEREGEVTHRDRARDAHRVARLHRGREGPGGAFAMPRRAKTASTFCDFYL